MEKENRECILAQYTIRSKQEYIFRSNRLTEIMGASANITESWNCLFEQAKSLGKKIRRVEDTKKFDIQEVTKAFEEHSLHMVELFQGGGNVTVLYDSISSYIDVNKVFSSYLLRSYPGMIPMAVCCRYTGNYQEDYRTLMQEAEKEKNRMVSGQSQFILPFSMMDRNTFQPYAHVIEYEKEQLRLTEESYAKRVQGKKIASKEPQAKVLDHLITEKNEESLLAVVHADGNNMGIKIAKMLEGLTDYSSCITKMRQFTGDTANAFVTQGLEALCECRKRLEKSKEGRYGKQAFYFRRIISDGDDITFVCNARFAMEYVQAYLKAVQKYRERNHSEWTYSSCAGICIFHSHYPFARAYSMAEQACDHAKEKVHGSIGQPIEESWVDFHYIHSGLGGDLSGIRKRQGTEKCIARPWRIGGDESDFHSFRKLQKLYEVLLEYGVSRSDIKTIGSEYENGAVYGRQELIRIYGHHKGLQKRLKEEYPQEEVLQRMLYDLAEVYDLWFKEGR